MLEPWSCNRLGMLHLVIQVPKAQVQHAPLLTH